MGYRRKQETLLVEYGGELAGLQVHVRQASPAVMRRVVAAAELVGDVPVTEQAVTILDLCDAFGQLLAAWNLEDDDGVPVPVEALADQDVPFVMALVYGWLDAVTIRAQQLTAAQGVDEATLPVEPVTLN